MSEPTPTMRTLQTLRLGPDQLHVEPIDNVLVWLASFEWEHEGRLRRGLTDCCLAAAPCRYHAALEVGESPIPFAPALARADRWPGVRPGWSR